MKKDLPGALPFPKATNETSALGSVRLGQYGYRHIPDVNMVTKIETAGTHHMSLKSRSSSTSSKSLGNAFHFRNKNNRKQALPAYGKPIFCIHTDPPPPPTGHLTLVLPLCSMQWEVSALSIQEIQIQVSDLSIQHIKAFDNQRFS